MNLNIIPHQLGNKPLSIVGLDPGTTIAFSVIGLDGNILLIDSGKGLSLSYIIEKIVNISFPLIVSTDKSKVPSLVKDLAVKLGCNLDEPNEDLKKEQKRLLVKDFYHHKEHDNQHELDSLAAALHAYNNISSKLEKANRYIYENNLSLRYNEFMYLVLKEDFKDLSFNCIKDLVLKFSYNSNPIKNENVYTEKVTDNIDNSIAKLISVLKKKNDSLKEEIIYLKENLSRLRINIYDVVKDNKILTQKDYDFNKKVDNLLKFKEERIKLLDDKIHKQEELIFNIKSKNDNLNLLISNFNNIPSEKNNLLLIKKINNLSYDEFTVKNKMLNIKNDDFVFVYNPGIISQRVIDSLSKISVILVSDKDFPNIITDRINTAKINLKYLYFEVDNFALINPKDLIYTERKIVDKVINQYKEERCKEIN